VGNPTLPWPRPRTPPTPAIPEPFARTRSSMSVECGLYQAMRAIPSRRLSSASTAGRFRGALHDLCGVRPAVSTAAAGAFLRFRSSKGPAARPNAPLCPAVVSAQNFVAGSDHRGWRAADGGKRAVHRSVRPLALVLRLPGRAFCGCDRLSRVSDLGSAALPPRTWGHHALFGGRWAGGPRASLGDAGNDDQLCSYGDPVRGGCRSVPNMICQKRALGVFERVSRTVRWNISSFFGRRGKFFRLVRSDGPTAGTPGKCAFTIGRCSPQTNWNVRRLSR